MLQHAIIESHAQAEQESSLTSATVFDDLHVTAVYLMLSKLLGDMLLRSLHVFT